VQFFEFLGAKCMFGTDTFTYKANDGTAGRNEVTVSIDVHALNHPPLDADISYMAPPNTVLDVMAPGVLATASDPDGNLLTAHLVSGTTHGIVHLNLDGSFTYYPDPATTRAVVTQDSFTYYAYDGSLKAPAATVYININRAAPALDPKSIPTLNQWMLVLLMLLLMGVAHYRLRYI